MKKQAFIHTHALLLEVREYLQQEDEVPPDAFAGYDAQPVRPQHIHRGKEAHEEALGLLLRGFRQSLHTRRPEHVQLQ